MIDIRYSSFTAFCGLFLLVTACNTGAPTPPETKEAPIGKVSQAVNCEEEDPYGWYYVECINCQAEFCPSGYVCGSDSHCHSHCADNEWNGDEGDVDCGGACADPSMGGSRCAAGKHCWTNWDCASGQCYYDQCL